MSSEPTAPFLTASPRSSTVAPIQPTVRTSASSLFARARRRAGLLAAASALAIAACDSGGGGGSGFRITSMNLPKNAVWQLNRPIKITFSEAVDFSSVNLNTINVRRVGGGPSAGEFFLESPQVVVFQPRCPTLEDLSDAGLQPGGVMYELNVLGIDDQAPITVKSTSGASLASGDTRTFSTPTSTLPLDLFFDPKVGPPSPVVRSADPSDNKTDACYVEIGGDPNNRIYFRLDAQGNGKLDPFEQLPLNLLSDTATQVVLVLFFDQPVDPSSENINATRLAWQFDAAETGASPDWTPVISEVKLEANCTETGALIRITPQGVLPPGTDLRMVQAPEFSDIVGQSNLLVLDRFAQAETEPAPGADALGDHYLEEFADTDRLDTQTGLGAPPAIVGGGALSAANSFQGNGGPAGTFDWTIRAGTTIIFNTDTATIVGGPGFSNSTSLTINGGVVDVNDFRIEDGALLKVIGPNPFKIYASGNVEILGELNISGSDNPGVTTLNTTTVPEPGSPGQAGGGKGGTGSPLITASDPKGGNGFGAFNVADAGGQGGETGWNGVAASSIDGRRGAGGGGGSFGPNQAQTFGAVATFGDWNQSFIGLDAERGFDNKDANANGALTGPAGPFGGDAGPSPFADLNPDNNFFGNATDDNGTPADPSDDKLITGELKKPLAGAGGGGGGDAAFCVGGTFPQIPFNPNGDEKGAGGAGGGGSLHILALGDIVFGPNGLIVCRGGSGGGGENTLFLNRVGGGSGGGSGGHVVLETAGVIDMSLALGPSTVVGKLAGGIIATGGQGGTGKADKGGALAQPGGKVETPPHFDACPPTLAGGAYPTTGTNACLGHIDGAGGDGGPGLVQLHAPGGWASILTPVGKTLADVSKPAPVSFDGDAGVGDPVTALLPGFGKLSKARSEWIALGEGGFDKETGTYGEVTFDFEGTDPLTGLVLTDSEGLVLPGPAVLGPVTLAASGVPAILDERTIALDAGPLASGPDSFLLENLELFDRFLVQLENQNATVRFDVVSAEYNASQQTLTLTVSENGPALTEKFGSGSEAELQKAYFRITSSGEIDMLPDSAAVQISFEAAEADEDGNPDLGTVVGPTFDVGEFNTALGNADLRFVRFEVTFDIDAQNAGLEPTNPIPSLDFLRIPFRYQ